MFLAPGTSRSRGVVVRAAYRTPVCGHVAAVCIRARGGTQIMPKAFERIFIIMLENQLVDAVRTDPYMLSLETLGVRLSDYHGVAHPSQPNYFAATAGLPLVRDDTCQDVDSTSIVDLLEAKGITWKAYMEDLPENDKSVCKSPDGRYFRKHNPFVSYDAVRTNPARLACVVNADRLQEDLIARSLPEFCWYTPNIENDGHSPPGVEPGDYPHEVAYLSAWLKGLLDPLLANPRFNQRTLTVVTFDESVPYRDNHVYCTLLGDMVRPDSTEPDHYDHYSLLRTVEENFGLGTLGRNDLTANWFRFLWNQDPPAFTWADHRQ
jgi:acid phosphatase